MRVIPAQVRDVSHLLSLICRHPLRLCALNVWL